jgi:preprotein translocase subunit YajC
VQDLYSLLPIVGIFLIFWLLVIRPASRRQKAVRAVQARLAVGDRVITNAGIIGSIVTVDDDQVGVQVAEGVVITFARPAIAGVLPQDEEQPVPGVQPTDESQGGE